MNVHIQNKLFKPLAIALSVLMFSISLTHCYPMTAHAEESEELTYLMDVALTQTGVSANYSKLSSMQQNFINIISGTASTYEAYCAANGLELKNKDSFTQYLNSDAFYLTDSALSDFFRKVFQNIYFFDWLIQSWFAGVEDPEASVLDYLIGTTAVELGKTYNLRDEDVEAIRATFDEMIESEGLGYYYINTLSPSEVNPSFFLDSVSYENFKSYIKSSDGITYAWFTFEGQTIPEIASPVPSVKGMSIWDNTKEYYIVCPQNTFRTSYKEKYGADWLTFDMPAATFTSDEVMTVVDYESFAEAHAADDYYTEDMAQRGVLGNLEYYASQPYDTWCGFFTKDGRKMIVFETLADLKKYLGGYREVYYDVSGDYSSADDNSVDVGGDFLNNGQYSHDIITENINNSENVNENVVNNVVGDTITNITNNYYTDSESGSGDSDSGSSDSGSSIWDGLTTLVGGIGDLLNFFVTLIGEVLSLLTNLLTEIMNLVGGFKDVSGDFVYFMADFFVFIPQEVWDVILLGVTAIIGLAVWKAFKN